MTLLKNIFNPQEFTGWHMISVMCLFFGTIISVNLFLAFSAGSTWTGLVVKNTYVESQNFNGRVEELASQQTQGWSAKVAFRDSALNLVPIDDNGVFVADAIVTGQLGRPVHNGDDQHIAFKSVDRGYMAPLELDPGLWRVQVTVIGAKGEQWIETIRFTVGEGS